MKTRKFAIALMSVVAAAAAFAASQPAGKSGDKSAPAPRPPADVASDNFNKVFREPGGKLDQARFEKVITAGISYLSQYPTHWNANNVIRDLPQWGRAVMRDRAQAPQRIAYLSLLKYELLNARYKEGLSNDAKAALAALDAATIYEETVETFTKQNLDAMREKLDELATLPGASRYLVERERAYLERVTTGQGPERAEEHLNRMLKHADKGVATMARQELVVLELKKAPYQLSFVGMDGKPVDFNQLRGKVVAMYFWNVGTRDNQKNLAWLQEMHSRYRRKGFEVVTVALDKAEDRPKVEKFIKDNGIKFPVHFDGQGTKTEFVSKLNTPAGRLALFDQKGILQSNNWEMTRLEGALKFFLEPPKKK